MTRRDDITARALDAHIDDLAHAGSHEVGAGRPLHLVDDLADAAELLQADADQLAGDRPDSARMRAALLTAAAEHDLASPRSGRERTARRRRATSRRAPRAHRVAVHAVVALLVCGATAAMARTDTPAGSAIRTAARTLNLPAPADPRPSHRPAPTPTTAPPSGASQVPGATPDGDHAPTPTPGSDAGSPPLVEEIDPRDLPLGAEPPLDGAPMPGGPGGDQPLRPGEPPKPPADGQLNPQPTSPPPPGPAPAPQPAPGDQPMPQRPPAGTAPAPDQPAPPRPQQPRPPAPVAGAPAGPAPTSAQPQLQPQPQPAPVG